MTFRFAGAVAILYTIDRSVEAFFIWQVVSTILSVVVMRISLWNALPLGNGRAFFQFHLLQETCALPLAQAAARLPQCSSLKSTSFS